MSIHTRRYTGSSVYGDSAKVDFTHFISRQKSPGYSSRWMVRVPWILGRVVVSEFHVQPRALGQEDRHGKPIILLPVKGPVLDPEQRFYSPVWQGRCCSYRSGD